MDAFALTAPRWIVAAVVGIPPAIVLGLVFKFVDGSGWGETLIFATLGGLLIAGVVVLGLGFRRRMLRSATGDASEQTLVSASRASWTGPVPSDPEIRSAALAIATRQLTYTKRFRIPFIICGVLLLVSAIGGAAAGGGWSSLSTLPAILGIVVAQLFYSPKRLRARIQLLSDDATSASS